MPIVPDESRTFGMEGLFRQCGIYSHAGQLYEPVDAGMLTYYREAKDGQLLEEGITEAGSMSSFIAAGTAYSSHGINMIPFFIYYSMFGFQRIGDLVWAACDSRAKGFLIGGTAGRTTLAGEGLQHQDGQSLLNALAFPTVRAYDPAFAYETTTIILDGMRRDVRRAGRRDLLHHGLQRELSPRGDARGGRGRHHPRHLQVLDQGRRQQAAPGATVRQRGDPPRGAAGARAAGREAPGVEQRVERHQLQRAGARRPGGRTLEHAPPGVEAAHFVPRKDAGRPGRAVRQPRRITCGPMPSRSDLTCRED